MRLSNAVANSSWCNKDAVISEEKHQPTCRNRGCTSYPTGYVAILLAEEVWNILILSLGPLLVETTLTRNLRKIHGYFVKVFELFSTGANMFDRIGRCQQCNNLNSWLYQCCFHFYLSGTQWWKLNVIKIWV